MSETETKTKFNTDQLAMILAALLDVKGFALRRFVEAVVELDGEEYNSFMVKALQGAPGKVLDLFKTLVVAANEEPATGKPTLEKALAEAMAERAITPGAARWSSSPIEPLKMQ